MERVKAVINYIAISANRAKFIAHQVLNLNWHFDHFINQPNDLQTKSEDSNLFFLIKYLGGYAGFFRLLMKGIFDPY